MLRFTFRAKVEFAKEMRRKWEIDIFLDGRKDVFNVKKKRIIIIMLMMVISLMARKVDNACIK